MNRWRPIHEDHAIERASVLVQFSEGLSGKPWQAIFAEATAAMPSLGYTAAIDEPPMAFGRVGIQIAVGGPGVQIGASAPPSGRSFQMLSESGLLEDVVIARDRFSFGSNRYPGWVNFKHRLGGSLGPFLKRALELSEISVLKLEFWDRFEFTEQPSAARYSELLNERSRYLPNYIFDAAPGELFHSHTGMFLPTGGPQKRLMNLNVDTIDTVSMLGEEGPPAPRRSIGIYTMVQDTFVPPASLAETDQVLSIFDEQHTILKDMFREAITHEAAERIALAPPRTDP